MYEKCNNTNRIITTQIEKKIYTKNKKNIEYTLEL